MTRCILLVLIVLCYKNLSAQDNLLYEQTFDGYSDYLLKDFDISCAMPPHFINMEKYFQTCKIRKDTDKHTGSMYGPFLLSANKECLIMYPAILHHDSKTNPDFEKGMGRPFYPRSQIEAELKTAMGLYYSPHHPLNKETNDFNFDEYVAVVSGKKARRMFNADSIYTYSIPVADSVYFFDQTLDKLHKSRYPYCLGVFLYKANRTSMGFKLFFTEKGKMKEAKYVKLLSKNIWYN